MIRKIQRTKRYKRDSLDTAFVNELIVYEKPKRVKSDAIASGDMLQRARVYNVKTPMARATRDVSPVHEFTPINRILKVPPTTCAAVRGETVSVIF